MKVIDLLVKIANGEEIPNEIKYNNIDYFWCNQCKIYERLEDSSKDLYNDLDNLNDEVEIIEEKKIPEKITIRASLVGDINNKLENLDINQMTIEGKINEIIDYLKENNGRD